jgi:hypothetical protein
MRHRGSMQASPQLEEIALSDANLILLAERELAAFARAVGTVWPETGRLSTADWIDELEPLNWPTRPRALYFRRITTAASAKLARREPFRLRMKPGSATTSSRSDRV